MDNIICKEGVKKRCEENMKGQPPHRQLSDKEITLGRGSQSERWDLEMGQEREIA